MPHGWHALSLRRAWGRLHALRRLRACHPTATTIAGMHDAASDEELAQQAANGQTAAFHRLTERYYRPVGGFIYKRVGRADLVEDLVQETFLEAWQALKAGRGPRKFSSWLFGIAQNRAGKWRRRKRPVLFDPSAAPDNLGEAPPE